MDTAGRGVEHALQFSDLNLNISNYIHIFKLIVLVSQLIDVNYLSEISIEMKF